MARFPINTIDGEWSDVVLIMAPNTKAFPIIATGTNTTFNAQFAIAKVSTAFE